MDHPVSDAPNFAWGPPAALLEHCRARAAIDLIYVHVPFGVELEELAGPAAHERFVRTVETKLVEILSDCGCPFGVMRWPADDIVAWMADTPHHSGVRPGLDFEVALIAALREAGRSTSLPDSLADRVPELTAARRSMPFAVGRSYERVYARVLRDAQRGACDPIARELQQSAELMNSALAQRAFQFHYQPIVDVSAGRVIAHEALCRGTMDDFRFPDVIFGAAERTQKIWDLGRVLRDLAADSLDALTETHETKPLLFINVHPADIDDPVFLEQALSGPLTRHARNIVIELTERAAIGDYRRVKEFFATLRRRGYRLAIDDLGSGYAGLTALAELEPDFIKFDMGLVRDLHLHPIKQRLIRRMHEFAIEIGAETISEGVENAEERDALRSNGCRLMQGYFFGRPAPQLVAVEPEKYGSANPGRGDLTGS